LHSALSSASLRSTSLLKANSTCFSIALGQRLAFLQLRSFQSSTGTETRRLNTNRMITYLQCPWQHYSFHDWGPEKGPSSQSVSQSVSPSACQITKKILSRICTCHPPRESSNQEACGEWAPQSRVPTYRDLHAHRCSTYRPIGIWWWLLLSSFLLIAAHTGSMTNARSER
jgi:hypothetical protein